MRDPKRIVPFFLEFIKLWEKYPDMRFGQLVMNVQATIDASSDPFYTEDNVMLEAIRSYAAEKYTGYNSIK